MASCLFGTCSFVYENSNPNDRMKTKYICRGTNMNETIRWILGKHFTGWL